MQLNQKLDRNSIGKMKHPKYGHRILYNDGNIYTKSKTGSCQKGTSRRVKSPWITLDGSSRTQIIGLLDDLVRRQVSNITNNKIRHETSNLLYSLLGSIADKLNSTTVPAGIKSCHFDYQFMVNEAASLRRQLTISLSQLEFLHYELNQELALAQQEHLLLQSLLARDQTDCTNINSVQFSTLSSLGYDILDIVEDKQLRDTASEIQLDITESQQQQQQQLLSAQ